MLIYVIGISLFNNKFSLIVEFSLFNFQKEKIENNELTGFIPISIPGYGHK